MEIVIINLEYKLPTVAQARVRLDEAFRVAKSQRQKVLKLIHGYGSSGKGGAIKKDVEAYLREKKSKGTILEFVSGEDFSPFNVSTRSMLAIHPSLSKDHDYAKGNAGITIVVVSR